MRPVTVLHCSDLHLGRQLPQGRSEELLMTFEDLILLGEQRKVDLFLIAGDLFDQPVPDPELVEFVRSRLEKLPENRFLAELQIGYLAECRPGEVLDIQAAGQGDGSFVLGLDEEGKSRFESALFLGELLS